ncbi:Acetyl-CoA acetyltransferase [Oryzisolibacter propanilivorax]|uniref:Acetyl-CoA acetyltransferase n=1 Tax=Oryzisolibacter propanilivorax TaxID=1527607 RepID=A0A1G9QCH0_9BURK|nr:thiolase [Oryzisolibacter propanilivorax]SDM08728.1 Acetyl-CoA acetyltransferase [Oryzisolibacter propanilivorax]
MNSSTATTRIPAAHLDAAAVNRPLRGQVAIAGAATYGCGEAPGMDDMALLARAAQAAVHDAGLTMQDIDGIATCSVNASMWALPVIEHLGLNPTYVDSTMLGGSSFIAHLLPAVRALQAGQCNAVLVCYGSAQRTATFGRKESVAARRFLDPQPYEHPYEPVLPVTAYALAAARHMHEFGTTRAQLAEVAVAARAWAQLNPEAFMRDPLSVDEVLAARPIASPLTVRDCCLVTDGGGAIVLVRGERARDLPRPPVYVLGSATAVWHRQISCMPDLTVTAAAQSGAQAFAMAGLRPADMDMAQLYDAFTINTLLFLEDLGFCAKGEGGPFVQGGAIAPGGRLAVNTNGGGLSCVHPGMYGIFALIEAVRQLRGEAGRRQLERARTAVVHGNGGTLSSQATAVLGTAETL